MSAVERRNTRLADSRRAILKSALTLAPAALCVPAARAQIDGVPPIPWPVREILKADLAHNRNDAQTLTALAESIERDFDAGDHKGMPAGLRRKLDDADKLAKRIRGRLRRVVPRNVIRIE